jgi:isochorismate synthase
MLEALLDYPRARVRRDFLQSAIREARRLGKPTVVSLIEPIAGCDLIQLFAQARPFANDRYFWAQPGGDLALVGLGCAHAVNAADTTRFRQAADEWQRLLSGAIIEGPRGLPGVGPLLLGGFAFDARRPATALWQAYPRGHLILPKLLYTQADENTWVTMSMVVGPETDTVAEAHALEVLNANVLNALSTGAGRPANGQATQITQHELRPAEAWQAEVARATRAIHDNAFEKVVLARAVQLQSTRNFDPARALRTLEKSYTGCYLFAIARDDGSHGEQCFLGATPELLVRLRDDEVHTMSLAGSIQRGETPEADAALGQALLDSAKDRREHGVVTQAVVEAVGEACRDVHVSEPRLLRLGNIQHLCTPITGWIAHGYTLFDLVERLHPTPAVGGRPREAALSFIREHEGLDRGWYAGPVGWIDEDGEGEFAVALRSALVNGHSATLFAGCGIMADSDPEREYAESVLKLRPMLAALTN